MKGIWAEEETCPKVSPLKLTRVIKGPKSRKMKEIEIMEVAEEPHEEEDEPVGMEQIQDGGQLTSEDKMQNRRSPMINSPPDVREISSEPAECSRSNEGNAEMMNMLVSIKKEIEEREKMWEQQQRIREEFLEAEFRRREQRWEQLLKGRDEECNEEMERRERALMQKLDSKINTFYNEQLKRDEDVLTCSEKREKKMEGSMLQKAKGFKYLYKEQFKEFRKLVEKRDKELEMKNNYRQKLWNESLDQVNSNLVNMHSMLTKLEGTMNNIGMRQDELITQVEYTNDHCIFKKEEPPKKEKPNISIPKFPPSLDSFHLEPPNVKIPKSYKIRR